LYQTRARARDAILRGKVKVDGRVATKPGHPASPEAYIDIEDEAQGYVSRAALKLIHGLDRFGISPAGLPAVDLGASTGGFTQVLIERGARHVSAVDVGHDQMAPELRANPHVMLIEGQNARDLTPGHLAEPPEMIVADLSFISLKLALPPALHLARPGAWLVALIKPQFEAGRGAVDKRGVVRDPQVHETVCRDISNWLETEMGWRVIGVEPSPIPGGEGNREFLIAARKP
jgi:23S rRNA (cytidine1920-2'-O)/16S rRNA (cytidine1409-2'-O)-methyltransferase